MELGLPPPEPLGKPGDELRLISNGPGRIAQLLDQCRECVLVPGPGARLPVPRSKRFFFHPARMTSRFFADYAESLICKEVQLADVAEAFGVVPDSA